MLFNLDNLPCVISNRQELLDREICRDLATTEEETQCVRQPWLFSTNMAFHPVPQRNLTTCRRMHDWISIVWTVRPPQRQG